MDSISSRWHKPKGRMSKRRKAQIENSRKRFSSSEMSSLPSNQPPIPETKTPDLCIISKEMWSDLLKNVLCSECGAENCLEIVQHQSYGLSTKVELVCNRCNKSFGSSFTSERETGSKSFSINNKIASAFLAIGRGHAALETFSMVLGTQAMDRKTFSKCLDNLYSQNDAVKYKMLNLAREAVRKAHLEADPDLIEGEVLDISVSFDGSWQKRGYTSNLGLGCVIDLLTDLVVDFEVLSKYCHVCTIAARDMGEDSAEYMIWKEGHAADCQTNHDGSPGSMEVAAALTLWKRSVKECNMRYTKVLSDGDSKAFNTLTAENVYGEDIVLQKEECINHVAKRLGTALRKIVDEWKVKNVTLGGNRKGSLTATVMKKLQSYYRKAIKENAPDIHKMKTAIYASLHHCLSTDKKPQHTKCPAGEKSWCFFQKAMALGRKPSSHQKMKVTLSPLVVEKILPAYQRLASDDILSRCIAAKTQNVNESLHSCIWRKCPKEVFVSKKRLELAVTSAVNEHNLGYVGTLELKNEDLNQNSLNLGQKRDNRRAQQKSRKSTVAYKQTRNAKKYKKIATLKKVEKKEGNVYGAGIAN